MSDNVENAIIGESTQVQERPNFLVTKEKEVQTEPVETVVTEAESTTATDSEESLDDEGKPLQSRKNYNKRIQQVIAQREEARQEAIRVKAELEALKSLPKTDAVKEVAVTESFTKPKPEMHNFATIGDFTEALSDWKDEQREHQRQVQAQKAKMTEATQKSIQTWTTRENSIKKEIEDYDAVVNVDALAVAGITNATHAETRIFLNESEVGPAVLYELLQDEELTKRFKTLSPTHQVKMLTKLELAVEARKTEKPESSSVPTSPPKLKGGIKAAPAKTLEEVVALKDFTEYAKFRKAQGKK